MKSASLLSLLRRRAEERSDWPRSDVAEMSPLAAATRDRRERRENFMVLGIWRQREQTRQSFGEMDV